MHTNRNRHLHTAHGICARTCIFQPMSGCTRTHSRIIPPPSPSVSKKKNLKVTGQTVFFLTEGGSQKPLARRGGGGEAGNGERSGHSFEVKTNDPVDSHPAQRLQFAHSRSLSSSRERRGQALCVDSSASSPHRESTVYTLAAALSLAPVEPRRRLRT